MHVLYDNVKKKSAESTERPIRRVKARLQAEWWIKIGQGHLYCPINSEYTAPNETNRERTLHSQNFNSTNLHVFYFTDIWTRKRNFKCQKNACTWTIKNINKQGITENCTEEDSMGHKEKD